MPRPASAEAAAPTAPAKAKDKPAPPPLRNWVPQVLITLIEHAPKNPSIGGLIRNELEMVMPSDMDTTKKISNWLQENYHNSRVAKSGGAVSPGVVPVAPTPTPEQLGVSLTPDGSMVVTNVVLRGTERGVASYNCNTTYSGRLVVPPDVVRRGWAHIAQWIQSANLIEAGLSFSTENYEHRNFQVEQASHTIGSGLSETAFNSLMATRPQT